MREWKKFIGLILLSALLLPAFGQEAPRSKVVAYYFHGDFPCPTCYKLEQYS